MQDTFYETLPPLPAVSRDEADIAWYIYKLVLDEVSNLYHLTKDDVIYTNSETVLAHIATPNPGEMQEFVDRVQGKIERQARSTPPLTLTPFEEQIEE